jgi:branched-chain amino acid transport system ATP-binding protein
MAELIRIDDVSAGYGDSVVLENVSLSLASGESLALLGRNGVGKTTLLVTLVGLTRLHRGRIHLGGNDVTRLPTHQRARAGLGWVPQERAVFPSLTVEEHLAAVSRPGAWNRERIWATFPRLEARQEHWGWQLSGGEQQMLAIARALMTNPRVLLLDEPLEGLAPIVVQELLAAIRSLVTAGDLAIIIVEQHPKLALSLAQRAVILDRGRIVHQSDSASLLDDRETLNRLLGVA